MTRYQYPQAKGCYGFNLPHRIHHATGVMPTQWGDSQSGPQEMCTFVEFDEPLSATQKARLDACMADSPYSPPSSPKGTVVKIKDIWEWLEDFKKEVGVDLELYYSETDKGSGHINQIELHSKQPMTEEQKQRLVNAYNALITEIT